MTEKLRQGSVKVTVGKAKGNDLRASKRKCLWEK